MKLLLNNKKSSFSIAPVGLIVVLTLLLTSCGKAPLENAANENQANQRGIFNGQRVIKKEAYQFASILKLSIDPEDDNKATSCTGTYLGKGIVLTAFHCVGLEHTLKDKDKPSIQISSAAGLKTSRAFKAEEVEVLVAPTVKEVDAGASKVPLPDMVLLKFSGELVKELTWVPAAKIANSALTPGERDVYIAGYGLDQFDREVAASGLLNYSLTKVEKVTDLLLLSRYQAGDKVGIVLPGDSGGPLYKFDKDSIVVYGVASTVSYNELEVILDGTTSLAGSAHSRTDTIAVKTWIEANLNSTTQPANGLIKISPEALNKVLASPK